ncbi:signal peptidase II [Halobacteriovorax sp. HLS]|uniref:signal peptidase II n=1 Tax=Halobacteriovorax sp. HLS TaxID=2234000 RepID=UPI000FDAA14D|nr:signal peptidase II [Halobacteriovorax sp. HLS]
MGKTFFKCLGIFTLVIIIDQISKYLGRGLPTLHYNEGVIFGLYSDIPSALRIIALTSISGFIFFIYTVLIYMLSPRLAILKYGISLFIGGIFGNVIDRTLIGKSIDFIPFNIIPGIEITFNIADVFQWVGAGLILYKIISKEKIIWHPENQRGKLLLYSDEQVKFASKLTAIVVSCSLIFGIFSFTYFRTLLVEVGLLNQKYFITYLVAYIFLSLSFALVVFISGIVLSHRTVGPIFAFESFIDDLIEGVERGEFSLREGDNFRRLEKVATKIKTHLNSK